MAKLDNKRIRELRLASISSSGGDMLISKLAEEIDIPHKLLTRMEYDEKYNPGVFTLLKVSEYYNVSLNDLIIKC
tara:strand:+ start:880 stop:1104 length:225 start_codon:yes stop_codon:yes gene_type:complete